MSISFYSLTVSETSHSTGGAIDVTTQEMECQQKSRRRNICRSAIPHMRTLAIAALEKRNGSIVVVEKAICRDVSCGCRVARSIGLNWRPLETRPLRGTVAESSDIPVPISLVQEMFKRARGRHQEGAITAIALQASIWKVFCLTPPTCHNCEFR